MLHCKFSGDYSSERIFKIGQYLTKLCVEHLGFTFLAHPVGLLLYRLIKSSTEAKKANSLDLSKVTDRAYLADMLNICARFHEKQTCSRCFRQITTGVTNKQLKQINEPINPEIRVTEISHIAEITAHFGELLCVLGYCSLKAHLKA